MALGLNIFMEHFLSSLVEKLEAFRSLNLLILFSFIILVQLLGCRVNS